uniref:ATP synthase F0 subunit 8 n=1 Tax=Podagrion sp. JY-2018 TaxID=2109700 RepID=A0A2R4FZR4_9HYME|nr:ATP synthase F0 subunit 8 [Podagrion sp. JY-2018]
MPQMMPLMWFFLFMYFTIIYLMFIVMIYYFLTNFKKNGVNLMETGNKNINFMFKW